MIVFVMVRQVRAEAVTIDEKAYGLRKILLVGHHRRKPRDEIDNGVMHREKGRLQDIGLIDDAFADHPDTDVRALINFVEGFFSLEWGKLFGITDGD